MARWFSDLFGRTGSDPAEDEPVSPASGKGGDHAGSSPVGASDQTVRIDRSKPANRLSWPARDELGNAPSPRRGAAPVIDRSRPEDARSAPDPHEEPTRLVGSADQPLSRRPSEPRARSQAQVEVESHDDDEATRLVAPSRATDNDPVVGWLVIIAGPGRGRSVEIGPGVNSIGRATGQKLCLNFGDLQISREAHASLIYDPRSHRFFLKNGEVRSLTYVDDEVVLAPVELKGGETIGLGDTRLRFVRFCDSDFNWS